MAGEEEKATPALQKAAQSWNWLALSQNSSGGAGAGSAGSGRGGSVSIQQNSTQSRGKNTNKRPLLLNRASQSQQEQRPKPKQTQTERGNAGNVAGKPVEFDTGEVEQYSKLRIADRTISAAALRDEMEGRKFIPLQQMDQVPKSTFTNGQIDWVSIGVLTRKTLSKPAANGSTFMVWGLSDLEGTELGVFLFGDAYEAHWRELTGSVVAVLNAALLPATEKNKFAFKASQAAEVVKLGMAVDFGICKGTTSGEARCRLAVNKAKSQYCLHHIAANFMQAGRSRQQLNNSTGSLRKALFAGLNKPKNLSAGVYTAAPQSTKNSGWNPIITKKRKRNDSAAGIIGVPTVLSASGAVVQRIGSNHSTIGNSASGTARRGSSMSLMDQIRQPPVSMNAEPSRRVGTALANPNQRATRGQKIISAMLAGDGKPLKRPKTKKVNMMQFMKSGK